LPNRQTP